jgi:hypothetical protein
MHGFDEAFTKASKNDIAAIIGECRQMSLASRFRSKQNAAFFRPRSAGNGLGSPITI